VVGLSIAALFSCEQPQTPGTQIDDQSTNDPYTIVSATALVKSASATCPNGGVDIATGFDENGNAQLDNDEITDTYTICNGDAGLGNLVVISNEPSGNQCTFGGKSVAVGVDANLNGVLDSGEIETVQYFCSTMNFMMTSYFCRADLSLQEEVSDITIEYYIQEYYSGEIQVTGEVITPEIGVSKTVRWSPWSWVNPVDENSALFDQESAWLSGLVKINLNVLEPDTPDTDDPTSYWLLGIDRKGDTGPIDPDTVEVIIEYHDVDVPDVGMISWPVTPTTLSECAGVAP
jgi:hypothetical protein